MLLTCLHWPHIRKEKVMKCLVNLSWHRGPADRQSHYPLYLWGYSVIILSHHSVRPTKIWGLPNFAFLLPRSPATMPLALQQAPQAYIWILLASTFGNISFRGGQPTGVMAFKVLSRMRPTPSPSKNICK